MVKRRKLSRQITLKDIAAATGVSINTVSRALRDKEDVSGETRERIMQVATDMGYINNMIASSLRLGYTNTIAVLLGDISNPFFAILMKNIESRARERGYASFLINTGEDDDMEREAIRTSLNKNIDGIIICPTQHNEDNIRYLMRCNTPFVLIGRYFPGMKTDFVACDDEQGGYLATRELIANGHKKILMLNGPKHITSARMRLAGYRRALKEAGLSSPRTLIREIGLTSEGCEPVAEEICTGRLDCTAVFAFSDLIALSLWSCLRKHGMRIPEDCSLIGFDGIQTRQPSPFTLTSIGYLSEGMGESAVDLLVAKIKEPHAQPQSIVIASHLEKGETVSFRTPLLNARQSENHL